jgi:hypothetical protein
MLCDQRIVCDHVAHKCAVEHTFLLVRLASWQVAAIASLQGSGDASAPAAGSGAVQHSAQRPGLVLAAQGYRPKHPVGIAGADSC